MGLRAIILCLATFCDHSGARYSQAEHTLCIVPITQSYIMDRNHLSRSPRTISWQVPSQFGCLPTVGYVGMYQISIHGSFRLLCRLTYYSYVQQIWRAAKTWGTVFFVVDTSHELTSPSRCPAWDCLPSLPKAEISALETDSTLCNPTPNTITDAVCSRGC